MQAIVEVYEPEPVDRVWEVLDPTHCDQCNDWSEKQQAWWTDPYEYEGQVQIREIVVHYEGVDNAIR